MSFLPGDKVKYVGDKFRSELGTKLGEIICEVRNHRSAVVVDFGGDAYICRSSSLMKFVPTPVEEKEIEIVRRSRFRLEYED
jgi:hypothetical protein